MNKIKKSIIVALSLILMLQTSTNIFANSIDIVQDEPAISTIDENENAEFPKDKPELKSEENLEDKETTEEEKLDVSTTVSLHFNADEIQTGKMVGSNINFGVSTSQILKPKQLAFRLDMNESQEVFFRENIDFELVFGSEKDPFSRDDESRKFAWFVNKREINSGEGYGFSFDFKPFQSGITAHNEKTNLEVVSFVLGETGYKKITNAESTAKSSITSIADVFDWRKTDTNANPRTNNISNKNNLLSSITYSMSTRSLNNIDNPGLVFAEKVEFKSKFLVPTDSNGIALIKFGKDQIKKSDGSNFNEGEIEYRFDSKNNVVEFTTTVNVEGSKNKELNNPSLGIKIDTPSYDAQQINNEFNLNTGDSRSFSIEAEVVSTKIYPVAKVKDLDEDYISVESNPIPNITYNYTNASETGKESIEQAFRKNILSIDGVKTTNSQLGKLSAYKNDKVVFGYGTGWKNKQEGTISSLKFEEVIDDENYGYKSSELKPLIISTGTVKMPNLIGSNLKLQISVYYTGGGGAQGFQILPEELLNGRDIVIEYSDTKTQVKKIEFEYLNVDPGFEIINEPKLTFQVLEQEDLTTQGMEIANKAKLTYNYNGKTESKISNRTYFTYKDRYLDEEGKFKNNKDGINLNNGRKQQENDVFLFKLEITNNTNKTKVVDRIEDRFTYNLSPYGGKQVINGNENAALIEPEDSKLLTSDKPSNLIIWKPTQDEDSMNNGDNIYTGDVQVEINETQTNGMSQMDIILTDPYELKPGETMFVTYTMFVNERYQSGRSIGNTYTAFDKNSEIVGVGEFWSVVYDPGHIIINEKSKKAVNATGPDLDYKLNPYGEDIIIYTLEIENKSGIDWANNVVIEDRYSGNLVPYDSLDNIHPEAIEKYNLKQDQALPLNIVVARDAEGNDIKPENFDLDKLKVSRFDTEQRFVIDLGDNVIKNGEKLYLNYTMMVKDNARPSELILNRYSVNLGTFEVYYGSHSWKTNKNTDDLGIASVIKSSSTVENNGEVPNINSLRNGDEVEYLVTISNYHPRVNKAINLKNVFDVLPKNMEYVNDSVEISKRTIDPSDKSKPLDNPIDKDEYEIKLVEKDGLDTLEIRFKNSQKINGGSSTSEYSNENIIVNYKVRVNVEAEKLDADELTQSLFKRTNTAIAFFEEAEKLLTVKSGELKEKNPESVYQDNDDATHSYVLNRSNAQIVNEHGSFGYIHKHSNLPKFDISRTDTNKRQYSIDIYNTGFPELDVDKVIDLLPRYEKIDKNAPVSVVRNSNGVEDKFAAIYESDKVTINKVEYDRLTFSGYVDDSKQKEIKIDGIQKYGENVKWSVVFDVIIDKDQAIKDMYELDKYEHRDENKVSLYTKQKLSLLQPNSSVYGASIVTNDNDPEQDWDSDSKTNERYYTKAIADLYVSTIAPYIDNRAQTISYDSEGDLIYNDYKQNDTISPGDIIAWKVRFGNSNLPNTPAIKKGSTLVVELPEGLTFLGYKDNQIPSYLKEIDLAVANENSTGKVLAWELLEDLPVNDRKELIIRTATKPSYFETYSVNSYFVPTGVKEKHFFASKIRSSYEYNAGSGKEFIYEPTFSDTPKQLGITNETAHYVYSTSSIDVLGNLGIAANMKVHEIGNPSNSAESSIQPAVLKLSDSEKTVRYSLNFNIINVGKKLSDLVLIDRLGSTNDRYVTRDQARRSQGDLKIVDDGDFKVSLIKTTTNEVVKELTSDEYKLQFTNIANDHMFTNEDWDSKNNSIWVDSDKLGENSLMMDDVTAFRVLVSDEVGYDADTTIRVDYTAKIENYENETWKVNNSFAYQVAIAETQIIRAETRSLALQTKVKTDRLNLVTNVIDPAKTPLKTNFDFKIIGTNSDGDEVYNITKNVKVDRNSEDNTLFHASDWVNKLPRDLTYKIEAKEVNGFRKPVINISNFTDQNNMTTWTIKVTYERIIYDEVYVNIKLEGYKPSDVKNVNFTLSKSNDLTEPEISENSIDVTSGQGEYIDLRNETGSEYQIIAPEVPGYKLVEEKSEVNTLDTTGKAFSFNYVYKRIADPVDPTGPTKPEVVLPSTGMDSKDMMIKVAIGTLMLVLGGYLVYREKKKNRKDK